MEFSTKKMVLLRCTTFWMPSISMIIPKMKLISGLLITLISVRITMSQILLFIAIAEFCICLPCFMQLRGQSFS